MAVPSRSSTPLSTDGGTGQIRLTYRLTILGRGQGARVLPALKPRGPTLTDSELKIMAARLHALDVAIVRELRAGTVFGQVKDAQLARLLPLLVQRGTIVGNQRLRLDDEPLSPRVSVNQSRGGALELTRGLVGEEGWLDISDGRLIAGSQAWFLRDAIASPVDSPAPWDLAVWALAPTINLGRDLAAKTRDDMVRDLAKVGVPQDDLELLAVRRGAPEGFVVQLWVHPEKTEPRVRLILEAEYSGEKVLVANQRPVSPYVVSEQGGGGLIERDLMAEEEARRQLRALGFRYDKKDATFVARGESALSALDTTGTPFPPGWNILRTADAPRFRRDLSMHTEIRLLDDRGLLDLTIGVDAIKNDQETIEALVEMKDLLAWQRSGRRYLELGDGSWVAPSEQFRQGIRVLDDLGAEKRRVTISPLCIGLLRLLGDSYAVRAADEATQAWLDELANADHPRPIEPPEALAKILRDYQRRGLDWLAMLHRHRLAGILADDMGLGKTVQTLALLGHLRTEGGQKPSLVVAPTSVLAVWRDEAARFTPELKTLMWHGPPDLRHSLDTSTADLVITSYGVLRRDADRLAKTAFRYVILDEAQAAKNAASQNARAVRRLESERRLALSGTPIENRTEELWAAFDFLAPGFLGSLRSFRSRYARPIARGDEHALALLRARVQPLVLRRMKGEVAKELPPKVESIFRCEMGTAQRALYDHLAGKLRESVLERIEKVGIERAQLEILAALTRLRQVCCDPALLPNPNDSKTPPSAKLALFEELMREALASERRVVVFSQFVKMQRILIATIKKLGVQPLWLHGGTRNRDKVVDAFQTPSGPPVIVVSLKAGGVGLTLTRADTVLHYDPWWNPAVEQQATDRAHRLGQTQRVSVYKLICQDSIEEKVLALAKSKDDLAKSLLATEGGAGPKQISRQDVLSLIS